MTLKVYYDFEFIEGTQDKSFLGMNYGKTKFLLEPISVGIVKETGETYYAIFNDFNLKESWNRYDLKPDIDSGGMKKVYWIRENVLFTIYKEHVSGDMRNRFDFSYSTMKWILKTYGKSKKTVAQEIIYFLTPSSLGYFSDSLGSLAKNRLEDNPVELYGYYSDYDHVCLAQCFGKMVNLPKGIPFYTKDIKQIMDEKAEREEFLYGYKTGYGLTYLKEHPNYPKQTNEHNSLSDAIFNKELHEFLNTLK